MIRRGEGKKKRWSDVLKAIGKAEFDFSDCESRATPEVLVGEVEDTISVGNSVVLLL